jgi:NAD(P)-dependent dehydrogenase (short-subunit alcohol dehydrogenase family)
VADQDSTDPVALVTGSTDGIGAATALGLAHAGMRVLVHGRDREKGRAIATRIERETDGSAALLCADFADRSAVEGLARTVLDRHDRLDVLVNNAGASFEAREETDAGVERTFAINHLAPFVLTRRLLPLLDAGDHARIITTSSGLHRRATLDFDDLQSLTDYDGLAAYGRSKLANVLFTYELARRLDPQSITANAFGPGFVPGTHLGRSSSGPFRLATGTLASLPDFLLSALPGPINTVYEGARTPIYLATDPEVKYVSRGYFENTEPVLSAPDSYDPTLARRLWNVSSDLLDGSR